MSTALRLPRHYYVGVVRRALEEDMGPRLVSVDFLPKPDHPVKGRIFFKEQAIIAGIPVVQEAFRQVSASVQFLNAAQDGEWHPAETTILEFEGPLWAILTAERTALNFLQRLSSIATTTREYCNAIAGTDARIADTRKTTPGLRALEKYAVRIGGGHNHRFGLFDAVMIKDNFLIGDQSLGDLVNHARETVPHTTKIVVECDTLDQVDAALDVRADVILLDNMSPGMMREAVGRRRDGVLFEASGGITLETVREVAESGVDVISIGALTHSVVGLDVSLELEPGKPDAHPAR